MLKFYPSNLTENLAFIIAEIMRREPLSNIFDQEKIVIQSYGMGTWLQQQISSELGIAAMIDCSMPASFIWNLAEAVLPGDVQLQNFEKQNLRWQLFKILPEKLSQPAYKNLSRYVWNRSSNKKLEDPSSILFELATVMADIFDGYQNYRPEWLKAWEQGATISSLSSYQGEHLSAQVVEMEAWQSDLWCSVFPNIQLGDRYHRASLLVRLERTLQGLPKGFVLPLPERIFVFGLSALPPRMLAVVKALAQHIDVHVVVSNPCRYYWGDVRSAYHELLLSKSLLARGVSSATIAENFIEHNPLLASWGKLGRDYMSLLMEEEIFSDVSAQLYDDTSLENVSALKLIQSDVLNLQSQKHSISREDESIRFSSCHSPLREVEALHDYLLSVIDANGVITSRDIIVMVPNIDDYAAYIDAVFSRPVYDRHGQSHTLSYVIADQALNIHQPLLECIGKLLSLDSSRLTGTELLDWLDFPAIRQRFKIEESELELIHHWVSSLNIRWGLSEKHRDEALGVNNSGEANTWLSAIRRLLGGYVVGSAPPTTFAGQEIVPEEVFGSDQQILVGKFARMIDVLEDTLALQKGKMLPVEALASISQIWSSWLDYEALHETVSQVISKALDGINEELRVADFQEEVPFSIVAQQIRSIIEEEQVSQRFLSGRINFCTLMPMRSVPFSVVCLLGMNEGQYPRPENKPSFDLLACTSGRVGDRSRRDDDRYLFLEALLSAREYLYISYTGRNITDNSERYPSVLVSELQDYCRKHFQFESEVEADPESDADVVEFWTRHHRLQAFNADYYRSDTRSNLGRSYNADWLPLLSPTAKNSQKDLSNQGTEISHQFDMFEEAVADVIRDRTQESQGIQTLLLDELVEAIADPLKYYYRSVVGLKAGAIPDELEESEPFALDSLDAYKLKGAILQNASQNDQTVFDAWRLAGLLPRPPMDEVYYSQTEESVEGLSAYLHKANNKESISLPVDFIRLNKRVVGSLVSVGGSVCEFSLSRDPSSSFFSVWVKHVISNYLIHQQGVWNDSSIIGESILICADKLVVFPPLSAERSASCLDRMMAIYEEAQVQALPFLPKTAHARIFESESKARQIFKGNQQRTGEMESIYWQRYCHNAERVSAGAMPDMESMELLKQVLAYKDEFKCIELDEIGE